MSKLAERRAYWIVFLAYLGIAVLVTWPLVPRMGTDLPDGADTLVHYWNDWWVQYALRNDQPLYYTSHMFYPNGITLVYHNISWPHILPWLVLEPLLGGVAAYNAIFVVYLALCGFAFFWLAYDVLGGVPAAFVAGLIYQCWPHRLSHPSHPNYMSTWAIPLFVLFLTRAVRRGKWWHGVLAGFSAAIAGYSCVQFLIPVAIVGTLYVITTVPNSLKKHSIRALLIGATVAVLGLAPMIAVMLRGWRDNPADLVIGGEAVSMQTDLLAYLTPPGTHPVYGERTGPAYDRFYPDRDSRRSFSPYLGFSTLVLAGLGVCRTRFRKTLPWSTSALILVGLALGPVLRVNGQFFPRVPMLYNLADRFYIVRLMREPDRFNFFLALPVALLAGYGINTVLGWLAKRPRWMRLPILFLVGTVILFEYLAIPLKLQPGLVSSVYADLAEQPGEFAVANIPVNPYKSKPSMFAQTVHGRPILQGHSSRYPDGAFDYLDSQPWLYEVRKYDDIPPRKRDVSRQLASLAGDSVRYLIVRKDAMEESRWQKWKRYLAVDPRFEDGEVIVYPTNLVAEQDYGLDPELLPGLGIVRSELSADCLVPGLPLDVSVAWGTSKPPAVEPAIRIAIEAEGRAESFVSYSSLVESWPTSEWPADTVVWGDYRLQTDSLRAGDSYVVVLSLGDPSNGEAIGAPTTLGELGVCGAPCPNESLPAEAVCSGALYGDAVRLLGHQVRQADGELVLTLHWRSVRRMDTDFKVFVHVFDRATGIPVAQHDAMPRLWRYPTTLWSAGEAVTDTIYVALEGVPPGSYGIAVGIYDPSSMERLPVIAGDGTLQPDGRLVLPDPVEVGESMPQRSCLLGL